jgi:hypothetical protein
MTTASGGYIHVERLSTAESYFQTSLEIISAIMGSQILVGVVLAIGPVVLSLLVTAWMERDQ